MKRVEMMGLRVVGVLAVMAGVFAVAMPAGWALVCENLTCANYCGADEHCPTTAVACNSGSSMLPCTADTPLCDTVTTYQCQYRSNWAGVTPCPADAYYCKGVQLDYRDYYCQDCEGCKYTSTLTNCPTDQGCYNGGSGAECALMAYLASFEAYSFAGRTYLRWETAAERNNLGFNLYRIDGNGQKVKLNQKLIAGKMNSAVGERYEFVVNAAFPGTSFAVESVDNLGNRSDIHQAVAVKAMPAPLRKRVDVAAVKTASRMKKAEIDAILADQANLRASLSRSNRVRVHASTSQPVAARLSVTQDGLYRVSVAELAQEGLNLAGLNASNVSLTYQGVAVPFSTTADVLTATDSILFYGQGNDSPHTSISAYFLKADTQAHQTMTSRAAAPVAGQYATTYTRTLRVEENHEYALSPAIDDFFYWGYVYPQAPEATYTASVTGIDFSAATFRFLAQFDGLSSNSQVEGDHHYQVYLNGHLADDFTWDGLTMHEVDKELSTSWLVEGDNLVKVVYVATESSYDIIGVDGFSFVYTRALTALNDGLTFAYEGQQPNVTVDGFTSDAVSVFDITDVGAVVKLTGVTVSAKDGAFAVSFAAQAGSRYQVMAAAPAAPTAIDMAYASTLQDPGNRADLLIISHDAFLPSLETYVQYRQSQGVEVLVAATSDIYNQFGYGMASDDAVKAFIVHAVTTWQLAPQTVLLVGDTTNDPKDFLGLGLINYVPSHYTNTTLWGGTTSDLWYADVDGNGVIDLNIGRLPVTTSDEAAASLSKVMAYEQADENLAGRNRVILIADRSTENLNERFEEIIDNFAAQIPADYDVVTVYVRDYATADAAHDAIMDELNKGAFLMMFEGHGSGLSFGAEPVFSTDDIDSLPANVFKPFVISLTCVSGYFGYPGLDIMGEALMKPVAKGAIATWMPADLGLSNVHDYLGVSLLKSLFADNSVKGIGHHLNVALNDLTTQYTDGITRDMAMTFVYMGDPAIALPVRPEEPAVDGDEDVTTEAEAEEVAADGDVTTDTTTEQPVDKKDDGGCRAMPVESLGLLMLVLLALGRRRRAEQR